MRLTMYLRFTNIFLSTKFRKIFKIFYIKIIFKLIEHKFYRIL